jgi:importin subunit beta-1
VTALLRAGERTDSAESNLRPSAYDALSTLVSSAPNDCMPVVQKTAVLILDQLDAAIQASNQSVGGDDKTQLAEHLTELCVVVQNLTTRMGKEVMPLADRIMTAFLKLFHGGVKTAVVVEDIFLAIGALVNGMMKS